VINAVAVINMLGTEGFVVLYGAVPVGTAFLFVRNSYCAQVVHKLRIGGRERLYAEEIEKDAGRSGGSA